jgi:hypothetical protein
VFDGRPVSEDATALPGQGEGPRLHRRGRPRQAAIGYVLFGKNSLKKRYAMLETVASSAASPPVAMPFPHYAVCLSSLRTVACDSEAGKVVSPKTTESRRASARTSLR